MTLSPRAVEAAARAIFEVSVYHGYTREFLESEWIRCKNIEMAKAKTALTAYHAALAVDGLCLVQGWHPIESAPKDGTKILAHCQPRFFETGKPMQFNYIGVVWWRGEKFKDSFTQWRSALNDSAAEPTHWMPLPKPPAASTGDSPRQEKI